MAEQQEALDFSNPNDPRVKQKLQEFQRAIEEEVIFRIEQHKLLDMFYFREREQALLEEKAAELKAEREKEEFMRNMQQFIQEAVQNQDKEEIEDNINTISDRIKMLEDQNIKLQDQITSRNSVIAGVNAQWKLRQTASNEKIAKELAGKIRDPKNPDKTYDEASLVALIEKSTPVDPGTLMGQRDLNQKMTAILNNQSENEKNEIFVQVANQQTVVGVLNMAARFGASEEEAERLTGPALLAAVKELKQLETARNTENAKHAHENGKDYQEAYTNQKANFDDTKALGRNLKEMHTLQDEKSKLEKVNENIAAESSPGLRRE